MSATISPFDLAGSAAAVTPEDPANVGANGTLFNTASGDENASGSATWLDSLFDGVNTLVNTALNSGLITVTPNTGAGTSNTNHATNTGASLVLPLALAAGVVAFIALRRR